LRGALDHDRLLHLRFKVRHPNTKLVSILTELADYEDLFGANRRSTIFYKIAAALKATPCDITGPAQLDEWDLPFLGRDSDTRNSYIPEILRTGRLERLEKLKRDPRRRAVMFFNSLPYVTSTVAKEWANQGLTSFTEVWERHLKGELYPPLKGEWVKLAVEHWADVLSPMTMEDHAPLLDLVNAAMQHACGVQDGGNCLRFQLVGGRSRGKETTHDLDILCTHETEGAERGTVEKMVHYMAASDAVERDATGKPLMAIMLSRSSKTISTHDRGFGAEMCLWKDGKLVGPSADGEEAAFVASQDSAENPDTPPAPANKALILIKLKGQKLRHMDVLVMPRSEWAYWVLGWTGSRELEKLLKRHAEHSMRKDLGGLRLGSSGLRTREDPTPRFIIAADGEPIPLARMQQDYVDAKRYPREEKDVWDLLGLPWRAPEDRNA
jgi:DNA polymerase/3'-5' exonuclease PolX